MSDGLEIRSERAGATVRVIVSGEIDIATAARLVEQTSPYLDDHAESVVLDLAEVSFIDSSGLHALLQVADRDGDRLRIVASPACLRLFDITGLRDRLPLIEREAPRA